MYRRLAPAWLLVLLFSTSAWAQRPGHVTMSAAVGAIWPLMNRSDTAFYRTDVDVVGGGLINYGISDYAGVEFGLLLSDQNVKTSGKTYTKMTLQDLFLQFRWNILTDYIQPYVTVGADYTIISLDLPLKDESNPGLTGGVGLEMLLTDRISVGVAGRYIHLFPKNFESARMVDAMATIAFSF